MDDEERHLVESVQQGNVESFNQLVQMYQGRIYNICYRMLGEAEAASDATQDTFLAAFHKIQTFRKGSFRSWITRIATNNCYDILRVRKRRPTTSLDARLPGYDDGYDGPSLSLEPADKGESPDDFALRQELGQTIQQALLQLPDDQRMVIILSDIQGMNYQEIAQITNSNLGTIKSRLSRGRARLRDILHQGELLPARYRHERHEGK